MSLRVLIPTSLLAAALLVPAGAADARSCASDDPRVADLKAKNVKCRIARRVSTKYLNRCMGAPCKITVADIEWNCVAEERNRCKKGIRKVTWIFAGGDHG